MELKLVRHDDHVRLECIGQFWEINDFSLFDKSVASCINEQLLTVVADFSRVSFISSQGLGRVVRAYSAIKDAGGKFILFNPVGSVRETIEISGFAGFMILCDTEQELRDALGVK